MFRRSPFIAGVLAIAACALAPPASTAEAQTTARDSAAVQQLKPARDSAALVGSALTRFCATGTSRSYAYIRAVCSVAPRIPTKIDAVMAALSAPPPIVTPPPPPPPPPTVPVASLVIHATATTLPVAGTLQLVAEPKSATGVTLTTAVQWSVATGSLVYGNISGTGLLTGLQTGSVTVVARADSIVATRIFTVTGTAPQPPPVDTTKPPVDTTTVPPPPPVAVIFSHPYPATLSNGAKLAELPRDTVAVDWPAFVRRVPVTPATIQAALDSARDGDALELPPGALFSGTLYPKNTAGRASWVTIRTAVPDDGDIWRRMTPARADSLNLATFRTANSNPAIWVQTGAHHVRFSMIRADATATVGINAVFRAANSETSLAALPHHIALDRVVVDAKSTDVGRCVYFDVRFGSVTSSTLDNCHSKGRDAQGVLGLNGAGPFRIENDKIVASHQYVMSGGGGPSIPGLVPCDWVIRGNWMTKPLSWKKTGTTYAADEWQGKTGLESKNWCRALVEGNVVENVWPDAQAGFCGLWKSTDQDNNAPQSATYDITVRDNIFRNCANGWNLAGTQQSTQPMSRISVYNNTMDACGFGSSGIGAQFLGGNVDIALLHNTVTCVRNQAMVFDGAPGQRTAIVGNIFPHGVYGVKGAGTGDGTATLNAFTTNGLFQGNVIVGGGSCTQYPAGTLCPAAMPAAPPLAPDGKPAGADMARVNAATARAVQ